MAKSIAPQSYPRIRDEEDKFHGFLDESALVEHPERIDAQQVKEIIAQAIRLANAKSSRQILNISPDTPEEEMKKIYEREGKKLFDYFLKYYGDPASTAFESEGLHYSDVAREQFRNRTLQKQISNAKYRNQLISRNPILSKYSINGRVKLIFAVLRETQTPVKIATPDEITEAFGRVCKKNRLVDNEGYFNNPDHLLSLFCNKKQAMPSE